MKNNITRNANLKKRPSFLLEKINYNKSDFFISKLRKFEKRITNEVFNVLPLEKSMRSKKSIGGTSPETVKRAIKEAEKRYL